MQTKSACLTSTRLHAWTISYTDCIDPSSWPAEAPSPPPLPPDICLGLFAYPLHECWLSTLGNCKQRGLQECWFRPFLTLYESSASAVAEQLTSPGDILPWLVHVSSTPHESGKGARDQGPSCSLTRNKLPCSREHPRQIILRLGPDEKKAYILKGSHPTGLSALQTAQCPQTRSPPFPSDDFL